MSNVFCLDLTVRDYELDQYGVVNNAVYQNYLELARGAFLASIGVRTHEVAQAGRSLALSEISLKYRRPLVAGEAFQIRTRIGALSGVRATFLQDIHRPPDEALVLEAVAVAVFLDARGRPTRIAPEVSAAMSAYLQPGS